MQSRRPRAAARVAGTLLPYVKMPTYGSSLPIWLCVVVGGGLTALGCFQRERRLARARSHGVQPHPCPTPRRPRAVHRPPSNRAGPGRTDNHPACTPHSPRHPVPGVPVPRSARLGGRSLVVLIAETGLRAGDACALPFDPLLTDSAGWPCLRFASSKMRAEHLLPLSTRAVEAIRARQHHVRETCPDGSACARALGPHLSATPASLRARRRAAWLGSPSEITGRGSGEVMVMKRSIVVRVDVEPRDAPEGPVSRSGSPRLFAVRFVAAAVPVWSGTPAGRSSRR